ncbi:MAG: hypothetical protein AB7P99_13115 [Vicinamibacterales bacterium]
MAAFFISFALFVAGCVYAKEGTQQITASAAFIAAAIALLADAVGGKK